jgi:2'-5' RNA ligase
VELPELDAVLDEHRRALDPSRPWGMPAHLTLLYPFVAPADVNGETLARLSRAATGVMSFTAAFADFGWFDEHVLWLAPSDPAPFTNLIGLLAAVFPEHPPYNGAFDNVVPHVTIGEGQPVDRLRAATDAIRPHLPLYARVTSLSLMAGSTAPGSWRVIERVPLGLTVKA